MTVILICGSSLAGAVLGGAVAGGAGVIILSRKGNKEVKSELIVHDTRKVKIKYANASGCLDFLYFSFRDYNVFEKLIPQKNFELMKSSIHTGIAEPTAAGGTASVSDRLWNLAELRNDGILTEEEYNKKKSELLKEL